MDIETHSGLWDELRVAVEEYLGSHPEYYSGNCAVFCFGASDPLKLQLGVFFEYSFNGGGLVLAGLGSRVEHAVSRSSKVHHGALIWAGVSLMSVLCVAASS